jgi:type IV secretion system protein VirB11
MSGHPISGEAPRHAAHGHGAGIAALADPRVIEMMVNPDGRAARRPARRRPRRYRRPLEPRRSSASFAWSPAMRARSSCRQPIVSAELPPTTKGRRTVRGPAAARQLALFLDPQASRAHLHADDYVADGIMSARRADPSLAVVDRKNILVVGGTSSGKTTLNALLAEMAHLDERVILIEDTREPQCAAPDGRVAHARGSVTIADLVRSMPACAPIA